MTERIEKMERELIPRVFDDFRENLIKYQQPDDKIIDYIKDICQQWNKTGPGFGIKIQTTNNSTHQGLAWYIYPDGDKIKYYLEEYRQDKITITPYRLYIKDIKNICYLGKSNTIRLHTLIKRLFKTLIKEK